MNDYFMHLAYTQTEQIAKLEAENAALKARIESLTYTGSACMPSQAEIQAQASAQNQAISNQQAQYDSPDVPAVRKRTPDRALAQYWEQMGCHVATGYYGKNYQEWECLSLPYIPPESAKPAKTQASHETALRGNLENDSVAALANAWKGWKA